MNETETFKLIVDYGKPYEEQIIDFSREPKQSIEIYNNDLVVTRSVYHFLKENCSLNKDTDMLNYLYKHRYAKSEECNFSDMQDFYDYLRETQDGKWLFGEGKPQVFNSYNGECNLSQTLQGIIFSIGGVDYCILQIHGGCDVRGGYSTPYIFKIEESFLFFSDASIEFNDGTIIYTDDAYNWYDNDTSDKVTITANGKEFDGKTLKVNGKIKEIKN